MCQLLLTEQRFPSSRHVRFWFVPHMPRATDISGTISATLTIHEDSELTGDVTCMVAGAPCTTFGAPGITLRLNGFTIAGPADHFTPTGCTSTTTFAAEDGIEVLQDGVTILGPGRVRNFRRWGIRYSAAAGLEWSAAIATEFG